MPDYACDWRFLVTIPFVYAAAILVLRKLVVEPLVFRKIGGVLGVDDTKAKRPRDNEVLEKVYVELKGKAEEKLDAVAKKAEMTPKQVSNWVRQRNNADKPSLLDKFVFSGWNSFFYFCAWCYGLSVMWDKSWTWDFSQAFVGFPDHPPPAGEFRFMEVLKD